MPVARKQRSPKKSTTPKARRGSRTKKSGERTGVMARIKPVTDFKDAALKMSIYGNPGTGKTTFAATFPKPMLIIGFEDGTRSISDVEGVDFILIENSLEINELIDSGLTGYKTVVVDTATKLQDLFLREILDLKELPTHLNWGLASRSQYGQRSLKTKEVIRQLFNLGKNTLVIAQEKPFEPSDDSELIMPHVGSELGSSTANWLNTEAEFVVQTFIRNRTKKITRGVGKKKKVLEVPADGVDYCLRVEPHSVYTTKFRSPRGKRHELPKFITDPSYDKFAKLL